jgi:hypothetical protein
MFNKRINISLNPDDVTILDNEILKTAGEHDFLKGHEFDPDFIYLLVRGVSAGEYWGPNNNEDFFEESELKQNHNTFLDAKVFKNHDNKDVAKGIGDVLNSEWDDEMKAVMLTLRIDKSLGPTITRGFLKGTITDVSMGCRVDHIICSYCGKRAKTRKEYCEHLTDKSIRGKIMPNGVQVYELNKTPTFHDISVVIKGADRTAKAFRVIDGKSVKKDEDLKKVASMESRIKNIDISRKYTPEYKLRAEDIGLSKTASDKDMLKIAEIDKILKGSLVAISTAENLKDSEDKLSEVVDILKLFYVEYFGEDEINEIVGKIKELAKKRNRPEMQVFKTFLRTAELAGIELSPLEYASIKSKLECVNYPYEEVSSKMMEIIPKDDLRGIVSNFRGDGIPRGRGFAMRGRFNGSPFEDPDLPLEMEIFHSLFNNDIMEERSTRPEHLRRKMIVIIKGDRKPDPSNLNHFILPTMSMTKVASEKIKEDMKSYASYQDARVDLLNSGELDKYASVVTGEDVNILKQAASKWGKAKRTAMLFPLVYGYSKYQKSKMDSGRRVSPFNRYIAEHPTSAFAVGAIGVNKGQNLMEAVGRLSSKAGGKLKKGLSEGLKKMGSDENILNQDILSEVSVFNNDRLNDIMLEKYSAGQIDNLKIAIYENLNEREDLYENRLSENNLSEDDCNYFLEKASDMLMSEIEKVALENPTDKNVSNQPPKDTSFKDNAKEVGKDVFLDTFFYGKNMGGGALSVLPGSVIDGIIFNKIYNKFKSNDNTIEKKEEDNINESL